MAMAMDGDDDGDGYIDDDGNGYSDDDGDGYSDDDGDGDGVTMVMLDGGCEQSTGRCLGPGRPRLVDASMCVAPSRQHHVQQVILAVEHHSPLEVMLGVKDGLFSKVSFLYLRKGGLLLMIDGYKIEFLMKGWAGLRLV